VKIGLDFDNTIACYDTAFAQVTDEWNCVTPETPRTKLAIRNYLRSIDNEDTWTKMQGHVYGPGIVHARPYPGVIDGIRAMRAAGHQVVVISHKTRKPFLGPPHDLHAFARGWLMDAVKHDSAPLFAAHELFFEETLPQKIARIGSENCDVFLDDLVDVLEHKEFPKATDRVLFDPNREHKPAGTSGFKVIHAWDQLAHILPR
jgi:hypothetical protein